MVPKSKAVDEGGLTEEQKYIKGWLRANGINKKWAEAVAKQLRKEYPALGKMIEKARTSLPELELIQLIDHTIKGRFPVKVKKG